MAEISVATYSLTEGDNGAQVSIVFSDGTAETVTDKHANFQSIVQALVNKPEGYGPVVHDLANIAKTVGRKFRNLSDRVTTDGSELFFDGDPIDGSLAQFILKLLREDAEKAAAFFSGGSLEADNDESTTTWEALVKFLELLYANPNPQSRESLYEFILRYGLTIRKDGHFIAYKGLQSDFGSVHKGYGIVDGAEVNGTLFNKPGSILRFPRKDVESNTAIGCAQGLHAGTHSYASNWSQGKLVAVAINPTNVISVPDDCTFQKIRVCEYEVLNEVDPLEAAVATSGANSSSFWKEPKAWDDNYNGVLEGVRVGDSVGFEYVAIDGREQTIDEARVEEVTGDYIRTFVPAKDGYRTFSLEGISDFVNFTKEEEEEDEEENYEDEDYDGYEGDEDLDDLNSEDDEPEDDQPSEEPAPEAPKAQTFTGLLDEAEKIIRGGGGSTLSDLLKGVTPEDLSGTIKAKAEKALKDSGLGDVVDAFKEGLHSHSEDEDSTADLSEGSVVSFDYIASSGESQHVVDAKVEEVQAEYFKAFVPAKNGYRTFKFDGVSKLKVSEVDESTQSSSEIKEVFDGLRSTDIISVELDKDGELLKLEGAQVLIHAGSTLTVRLKQGGYKAFTLEDVRSISKN